MGRTKIVLGLCLLLCGVACGDDEQPGVAADSGMPDGGGSGGVGGSGGAGGNTGGSGGSGGMGGSGGTGGSAGMEPDEDGGVEETADAGDPPTELPDDGERLSVCMTYDDCTGDDLTCTESGLSQGFCAQDCLEDDDCDAIDGIEAICDWRRCVVDCGEQDGGASECPDNMECAATPNSRGPHPAYRCQYPKDGEVYEECDIDRDDADCMEGLTCLLNPDIADLRGAFCAEGCEEASDCDDLGTSATPVCDRAPFDFPSSGRCALECEENDDCPDFLNCLQVDSVMKRCATSEPL